MCLLFLTTKEKDAALGAFVKSAFKNYSKSKEKLDSHESADYHKRAVDCTQKPSCKTLLTV